MIKFLSCIEGFYAPKSYTIGRSFLNGYLDGQCVEVRCKESRSNLPANLREKGLLSRQECIIMLVYLLNTCRVPHK